MGQHLTVYHIKSEFAEKCKDSFELLLRNPEDVLPFDLTEEMPFEAQLFVSKPKEEDKLKQPSWVAFLEEGFAKLPVPKTQSIGAVLFARIPYEETEEIFTFTFGGGRHFLNPKSYDKDYGLRVVLNVIYDYAGGDIEPNRLKSVAATTIAANTIRTRKQTDRQASFEIFGVDARDDTLNAVTGTSVAKAGFWSSLLSGSESLATTPGVDLQRLGDYCKALVDTHQQDTYDEQGFGWIDNRREITDPDLVEELRGEAVKIISTESPKISLTVPEIIDWEKVDHFSFSFDEEEFPDPGGVDLLKALKKIKGLKNKIKDLKNKIEDLKNAKNEEIKQDVEDILRALSDERLIAKDSQDNEEGSWFILDCLSGEIEHKGRTYILSEGQVYEIHKDFLQEINAFIEDLQNSHENSTLLPDCPEGMEEGHYNELTAECHSSLLLLDKKTVSIPGRTTPIEICDLLTDGGCFVHVKRKLHSSSLSHLFEQGFVSAELLLRSQEYRFAALDRIRKEAGGAPTVAVGAPSYTTRFSRFGLEEITPRDFEVSYAIIAKWKNRSLKEALPFFSKITLRKHVEILRRMGYKVSVARINVV